MGNYVIAFETTFKKRSTDRRLIRVMVGGGAGSNSTTTADPSTTTASASSNSMDSNIGLVASIPKPHKKNGDDLPCWHPIFDKQLRPRNSRRRQPIHHIPYMDMVGIWEVRDEVCGETIGNVVMFFENGNCVQAEPLLEGLRWRLDPGPTHLDTCTFQVLSTIDRTILQYRGFIDRGARLDARYSKRPLRIRGSVMFPMRDGGSVDFNKDMLPPNLRRHCKI
jgi:hypothetical protein